MSALKSQLTGSEVAWTRTGMWVGHGRSRRAPKMARGVPHQCIRSRRAECGRFECSKCKRIMPWCWGGSEDCLCDDCWCANLQEAS